MNEDEIRAGIQRARELHGSGEGLALQYDFQAERTSERTAPARHALTLEEVRAWFSRMAPVAVDGDVDGLQVYDEDPTARVPTFRRTHRHYEFLLGLVDGRDKEIAGLNEELTELRGLLDRLVAEVTNLLAVQPTAIIVLPQRLVFRHDLEDPTDYPEIVRILAAQAALDELTQLGQEMEETGDLLAEVLSQDTEG